MGIFQGLKMLHLSYFIKQKGKNVILKYSSSFKVINKGIFDKVHQYQ